MSGPHIGVLAPDLSGRHGWSRYAIEVIAALRAAGAQVTAVTTRQSPPHPQIAAAQLLPDVEPMAGGLLLRQIAAVPGIMRALRGCTVIHSLIEPFAPAAAIAAGDRPLIITGHGSYVRASAMRRFPASAVYASAYRDGLMVCVSRYTETAVQQAVPGISTRVIANGVDAARFASIPRDVVPGSARVLFVGAVKARKGVLALVLAMAAVRKHYPKAHCMIVGALDSEPAYVEQVRAAIAANGLADAVTLAGRLDEAALLQAYADADVFALPSLNDGWKFEGFGLSLLEASAAGLPVIGTLGCGAKDAVVDGATGLLIRQDSQPAVMADDLAHALATLLADPALRSRMGAAGRAHAAAFTWARTAASLLSVYREVDG